MHEFVDSWLVWIIMDKFNIASDFILDTVQFFLHVIGSYEMGVSL